MSRKIVARCAPIYSIDTPLSARPASFVSFTLDSEQLTAYNTAADSKYRDVFDTDRYAAHHWSIDDARSRMYERRAGRSTGSELGRAARSADAGVNDLHTSTACSIPNYPTGMRYVSQFLPARPAADVYNQLDCRRLGNATTKP